jgi:glucose-1-phosphate cytidylyltransferase
MQVIILCGGLGSRLREETEYKPKPMIEIGNKPILWHIMKHYDFYGYREFVLALGYKGNIIRDYFINYLKYNSNFTIDMERNGEIMIQDSAVQERWKITMVETGESSMTGYRIKLCGRYIREDNFMVTYGDAVSDVMIQDLVDFHLSRDTIGTVTGVYPPSRFGDLITRGDRVVQFNQQKKDTETKEPINGGYFVFKSNFLQTIPDDPATDLEKAPIQKLVEKNQLSVFRHRGFWQCMDTYRDYQYLNHLWKVNPVWKNWSD